MDEKIGVTYFNMDKAKAPDYFTSESSSQQNTFSPRENKLMSRPSLDDSCADETLSMKSGFGRDSFSTPEGYLGLSPDD